MAILFNSTGNNFGAGQIAFKSHQEENFVVLNAKVSYDPTNADYQAADVLEIYVPDLSIERSAVNGVILTFKDRYVYLSYTWNNDGGTAIKSWIKDKNTICLEKFTNFDDKGGDHNLHPGTLHGSGTWFQYGQGYKHSHRHDSEDPLSLLEFGDLLRHL